MRFRLTGLLSSMLLNAITVSRLAIETMPAAMLGTRETGATRDLDDPFCTQAQMDRFDPATMQTDLKAMVHPIGETEKVLSAVIVTLPPFSCVYEHTHWGAMVLYVQSGQIDFVAEPAPDADEPEESGLELVVGTAFTAGAPTDRHSLGFGDIVTLRANQWVTQTGMVRHAFRNTSLDHPAVLISATYSKLPPDDDTPGPGRCNGRCVGSGG